MKTRDFLLGMLACFSLVACSSEDVVDNNVPTTGEGKEAYLRIKVDLTGNDTGGRAATQGEYDSGSSDEYGITSVYFAVYDKDGNWYAGANVGTMTTSTDVVHPEGEGSTNNNNDATKTEAIVILELDEKPADDKDFKLVAYANINNAQTLFQGVTLAKAQELMLTVDDAEGFSTADKFPMTNSTYLVEEGGSATVTVATSFKGSAFQDSEEKAKNQSPIIVHIERLAAKVTVKLSSSLVKSAHQLYNAEGGEVTKAGSEKKQLTFFPASYRLNTTNLSSYYLKNVDAVWATAFNLWDGWNVPTDFRCFWAKDPNYGSEDINEAEIASNVEYTTLELEGEKVTLPDDVVSFGGENKGAYCLENTFDGDAFNVTGTNNFKVATHVLIFGQYKTEESATGGTTFYHYFGKIYEGGELLELWVKAQGVLYTKSGETYSLIEPSYSEDNGGYQIVSNGKNMSDVTLQFVKGTGSVTYYKKATSGSEEYVVVTDDDITALNTHYKEVLTAEGYRDGWAYFAVPIEHFGPAKEGTYDGTGSYGIVRNHSYILTVNKIQNLGTGIFAPADFDGDGDVDPIIPDEEKIKYYIASTLRILSWKKVNQDVEL